MLENLDKIEWDKLGHAYGPAKDVPGLIRKLASPDEAMRGKVWHELHGNIWHQGTVYQATAYAVPFFIELLTADEVQDKHEILGYLALLIEGNSYKDVHQHLPLYDKVYGGKMKTTEWQEELKTELSWVKRVQIGVAAGRPVYLKFLADPAESVRDNTAYLLSKLDRTDGKIREQIENRLEVEENAMVQASLLLALGKVSEYNEAAHALLSSFIDSAHPKAVQLAATIALAGLAPEHVTPEMISRFVEAIQNPDDYAEFEESIWADGDTAAAYISRHFQFAPGAGMEAMEIALLQALGAQNIIQAQAVANALLNLVWNGPADRGVPFSSLESRKQRVLKAFVDVPQLWGFQTQRGFLEEANTMNLMRAYNLPTRLAELSAYVRGEPMPVKTPLKAVKSGGIVARIIRGFGRK